MFVQELLFMFLAGNRLGTVSLSQEKKRFKKTRLGNLEIVALWTCGSTRNGLKRVCSETRFVWRKGTVPNRFPGAKEMAGNPCANLCLIRICYPCAWHPETA